MEGGPPGFPQGFSCLVVLWILSCPSVFAYATITLSGPGFPSVHSAGVRVTCDSPQPRGTEVPRFGLFRFRSPLLAESRLISLPGATEMFQFTPSSRHGLCIHPWLARHSPWLGFPIRTPTVWRIFAPTRGFSQLVASFIGYRCQGIHPVLLVT